MAFASELANCVHSEQRGEGIALWPTLSLSISSMLAPAHKRARLSRAPWTRGRVATLAVAAALLYTAVSTSPLIAAGGAPRRHKHDRFLQQTTASGVRVIVRTRPGQLASVRDRLQKQGR